MTLSNNVNDSKFWRDKAAEMRIMATMMDHVETQAIMVRLAEDYDELADRAEVRSGRRYSSGTRFSESLKQTIPFPPKLRA